MSTPLTEHFMNPASILFGCPKRGCDGTPGVMCLKTTNPRGERYKNYFHTDRVLLADAVWTWNPRDQEAWQVDFDRFRELALRGLKAA